MKETQLMNIFDKITRLMEDEKSPPCHSLTLGFWLARVLDPEDFELLDAVEAEVGEDGANRQLVTALVESGKWVSDDGESVERAA